MKETPIGVCAAAAGVLALWGAAGAEAGDSVTVLKPEVAQYSFNAIPRDPLASAIMSTTVPGSGQIYNKEYLSGALTLGVHYGSFFLAQRLVLRWQRLNMDTTYFLEVDADGRETGYKRAVYVQDSVMVGLPPGEKALLAASAVLWIGSWVWSIYDAYKGAYRYNSKYFSAREDTPGLKLAVAPDGTMGVRLDLPIPGGREGNE
jgi:hypothetical protein